MQFALTYCMAISPLLRRKKLQNLFTKIYNWFATYTHATHANLKVYLNCSQSHTFNSILYSTHCLYINKGSSKLLLELYIRRVQWTYSSSSSSAILDWKLEPAKQSRSSIPSVVEPFRLLVNHGGLFKWQHLPPPSQTWPSQSGVFEYKMFRQFLWARTLSQK